MGVSLQWVMAHNAYTFRYRVRNWHHYNQALIARGRITFWIDKAALAAWKHSQTNRRHGAPRIYSDTAIHCALVVKSVYGLSLRAVQGFVSSVMRLMRLDLPVPNYSTICRRQASLKDPIVSAPHNRTRHIVIDATSPSLSQGRKEETCGRSEGRVGIAYVRMGHMWIMVGGRSPPQCRDMVWSAIHLF